MTSLAPIAALVADPAREAMLAALLSGEALTAGELARVAGVAPPTASGHLSQLVAAGLLAVHARGRHRYHRLASAEVAPALEALGHLASAAAPRPAWPHGDAFRAARLCWDHVAGRLGVALRAGLVAEGWIAADTDGWAVTGRGEPGLRALGIDLAAAARSPRFACDCMDWSERRPHLAGGLGRELARACLDRHWLQRLPGERPNDKFARRRLRLTPEGARRLAPLLAEASAQAS